MAVERRGAAIDIVGLGKEYLSGQGRVVALDDINLRIGGWCESASTSYAACRVSGNRGRRG